MDAIGWLPDKSSDADPVPTSVLKQTADLLAPYIVDLFNPVMGPRHIWRDQDQDINLQDQDQDRDQDSSFYPQDRSRQ